MFARGGTVRNRVVRFADVLQISLLGPLEVRRDGRLVSVPGGKASELLVRLALDAGALVRADRLVDDLWAAGVVSTRRNTLQSKVDQAAPGARRPAGDRQRRRRLHARCRAVRGRCARRVGATRSRASRLLDAGDDRGAADLCASTLKLYRGEVLPAAGDGEWVAPHRARLEAGTDEAGRDPVLGAVPAR